MNDRQPPAPSIVPFVLSCMHFGIAIGYGVMAVYRESLPLCVVSLIWTCFAVVTSYLPR